MQTKKLITMVVTTAMVVIVGYLLLGFMEPTIKKIGDTMEEIFTDMSDKAGEMADNTVVILPTYTVNHYKVDLSENHITLCEREILLAEINTVTPEVKEYAGYDAPPTQTVEVMDDSSTIVNYYYLDDETIITNSTTYFMKDTSTNKYIFTPESEISNSYTGWCLDENAIIPAVGSKVYDMELSNDATLRKLMYYSLNGPIDMGYSHPQITAAIWQHTETYDTEMAATILGTIEQLSSPPEDFLVWTVKTLDTTTNKNAQPLVFYIYDEKVSESNLPLEAGLYDRDNNLLASWDVLTNTYGLDLETNYTESNHLTSSSSLYSVINNANLRAAKKMVIDSSITTIGNYALASCINLTSIEIPESVETIGRYAFYNCSRLISVNIPENITHINSGTYSNCSRLRDVILPENVTAIDSYAFSHCESLTSVKIPANVTTIGNGVFNNCGSLMSIIVDENNTVYDSRRNCNAIIESSTNKLLRGCNSTIIPESVTTIGSYAFNDCTGLISVEIPESVTTIGSYAFNDCTGLISVEIPEGVTTIGEHAFYNCTSLTSIEIPKGINTISYSLFYNCKSLESITLSQDISALASTCFGECSSLKDIYYGASLEKWGNITKGNNWNKNSGSYVVHCTDGNECKVCTGGVANCSNLAVCPSCGKEYGDYGNHNIINGSCDVCGITTTTIETTHNPYENNQNYVVLGTWDYSDASSVTIILTYQTQGNSYDWVSVTEGTDYVAGSSQYSTRNYLTTRGRVENTTGNSSSSKFGSITKTTKTFEKIDMLTGSVIFCSNGTSNDYYGVTVEVIPYY